jgi:excisionase family DNA binding protein
MTTQQEWFTVDEAAKHLRVSKRTIYRLCHEKKLMGYRTSKRGSWRFRKDELDKALKKSALENQADNLVVLTAEADPVLAEVWDNEKDAAYDRV